MDQRLIAALRKVTGDESKLLEDVYKVSEQIYGKGFLQEFDEEIDRDEWEKRVLEQDALLDSFGHEFPVYRALCLDSIDEIKTEDLGVHWTHDKDDADCYINPEGTGTIFYLEIMLLYTDINRDQTLALLSGPHHDEKEISIDVSDHECFLYDDNWNLIKKFSGSIKRTWSDIIEDALKDEL